MDSILWFHLECPKAASKFDDPIEFKRKWARFFAEVRTVGDVVTTKDENLKKLDEEYTLLAYPEDIKEKKEFR